MTTLIRSCTKTRPCSKELCEMNCETKTYDCVDNRCVPNSDGKGMLLTKCREECFVKQQDDYWTTMCIVLGSICGIIVVLAIILMIYYFFFAKHRRK